MQIMLEYRKNYLKTSDEPNSGAEGGVDYSIRNSKSLDYKTSITGKLGDNRIKDVQLLYH